VDANGIRQRLHIGFADRTKLGFEADFVSRNELVCHGFAALTIDRYCCLARILAAYVAGQGRDDHGAYVSIGRRVAHNHRRP